MAANDSASRSRNWWQRIATIGIDATTNAFDAQRIRVTNVTTLHTVFMS